MAHDYWPRGEAIGKRIQLPGEKQMRQIVGIARTANYSNWAEPPQLCVYVPLEQNYSDAMTLYVRSKGDPQQILTAVQRELHAAAPQILVSVLRTGRQIIDRRLVSRQNGRGAAERVRTAGAGPGKHRVVRHPGVFGESAKTRDRVAHGIRRGPHNRAGADSESKACRWC